MSAAKKTDPTTGLESGLPRIFSVRGKNVVLDSDLARLYGVPTKRLNEAIRRNASRFPRDFCFYVNQEELVHLRSQIATLNDPEKREEDTIAVLPENREHGKHSKYKPRVFTEHGALMAANVLRSEKAVEMSLYLIRAFIEMREALLANATILKRLAEIDKRLIEHDSVLREIVDRLQPLLDAPAPDDEEATQPKIGFHRGNR